MWLRKFKLAVVQKDVETIDRLLDKMPSFEKLEELEEAAYLIKEAYTLMAALQSDNESTMQQLQKNIKFLKATQNEAPKKLDITS
jgi:hypothetical protein